MEIFRDKHGSSDPLCPYGMKAGDVLTNADYPNGIIWVGSAICEKCPHCAYGSGNGKEIHCTFLEKPSDYKPKHIIPIIF